MDRFTNAMTRRAEGPGALDFTALLRRWERAGVWPRLRRCATSRERYGTQHHAQTPAQERVETHAQNSHGGPDGPRRAGNSRMRKVGRFLHRRQHGTRVAVALSDRSLAVRCDHARPGTVTRPTFRPTEE